MSAQTLEQSAAQAMEPDAETVKKVLAAPQPVRADRVYHFTIELFEYDKTARIKWTLDDNYAIGPLDELKLMDGYKEVATVRVPALHGEWNTGKELRSGYSACYWAWSHVTGSAGPRELVRTLNT